MSGLEGRRSTVSCSEALQGITSCPAEKKQEGYAEDICRGAESAVTFGNFSRGRDY
jgi:hypothetical protein